MQVAKIHTGNFLHPLSTVSTISRFYYVVLEALIKLPPAILPIGVRGFSANVASGTSGMAKVLKGANVSFSTGSLIMLSNSRQS